MNITANIDDVLKIISAEHHDPFNILGMHIVCPEDEKEIFGKACTKEVRKALVVRAFLPNAECASVVEIEKGKQYKMERVHESGFFELLLRTKCNFHI